MEVPWDDAIMTRRCIYEATDRYIQSSILDLEIVYGYLEVGMETPLAWIQLESVN